MKYFLDLLILFSFALSVTYFQGFIDERIRNPFHNEVTALNTLCLSGFLSKLCSRIPDTFEYLKLKILLFALLK